MLEVSKARKQQWERGYSAWRAEGSRVLSQQEKEMEGDQLMQGPESLGHCCRVRVRELCECCVSLWAMPDCKKPVSSQQLPQPCLGKHQFAFSSSTLPCLSFPLPSCPLSSPIFGLLRQGSPVFEAGHELHLRLTMTLNSLSSFSLPRAMSTVVSRHTSPPHTHRSDFYLCGFSFASS